METKPTIEEIEEWKQIYEVLIHFSSMIMQARTVAFSLVIASYGAGTYVNSIDAKDAFSLVLFNITPGQAIILFGVMNILSVFIVDYFYYYRLLIATVDVCQHFERDKNISSSLSQNLSKKVSIPSSNVVIFLYYGIPISFGCILVASL